MDDLIVTSVFFIEQRQNQSRACNTSPFQAQCAYMSVSWAGMGE